MRGYIYTLDVAIALLIIIIGIVAFVSLYSFDPDTEATQRFTSETMSTLESIELQDLCTDSDASDGSCACTYDTVTSLCEERTISRMDQSILSAMGELYAYGYREEIENLTDEIIEPLVPRQYDFKIWLEDPSDDTMHQLYPLEVIS